MKQLTIIAIFGFFVLGLSAQAADLNAVVGKLGFVEGTVLVDNVAIKDGASVREGAVIEVKEGKATLMLGKGSVFHLAADTKMIVREFGVQKASHEEKGQVDLQYGKTRALVLNQGTEKKDLKIKARSATMGVRGTEVFVSSPREASQPVHFFTIEGKAVVQAYANAPTVAINQNQGVATTGVAPPPAAPGAAGGGGSSGGGGNGSAGGAAAGGAAGGQAAASGVTNLSASDAKAEIKSAGLDAPPMHLPQDAKAPPPPPLPPPPKSVSDQVGIAPQPVPLDPVQDRISTISLKPKFCSATGVCN